MVWWGIKKGDFPVQSFYFSLASRRVELFLCSTTWNSWAHARARFSTSEATWAKTLTQDQLRRREWRMPNKWHMCKAKEETRDHILLHCPKASILWKKVFALFHVQWVMHSSVRGVLLSWSGLSVGKKMKNTWKVATLYIFWFIWREINRRAFVDKESLNQTIKSSFLYLFWNWVGVYIGDNITSLIDFVDWLDPCRVWLLCFCLDWFLYMYTSCIL